MQKPVRILADSTMLYSAILFKGQERRVLTSSEYVFYATDFNAWELAEALKRKNAFSREEANQIVRALPVIIMPLAAYEHKLVEADEIIGKRDKKDVPLLALAFSIKNDGIWTSDKDFQEVKAARIWSTRELL